METSPQPPRWLGARPAQAGLCFSLPAIRLSERAVRVREGGRKLACPQRGWAELLEERRLKVATAPVRGMGVHDADLDAEFIPREVDRCFQIGVVRDDDRGCATPAKRVEQQVRRDV